MPRSFEQDGLGIWIDGSFVGLKLLEGIGFTLELAKQ